jgi:tetratricopeptide (TPR) repeat protein
MHASVGNIDRCLRSLDKMQEYTLPASFEDDIYATGFNPSRAAGYSGACFVRLHQPERALPSLQQAFTLCDATSLRRRSTLIADIGTVYAQLGDPQEACRLLGNALEVTMQTKSLVVVQRICKARKDLDPWGNSADVKQIDEHITTTFTALTVFKEQTQR